MQRGILIIGISWGVFACQKAHPPSVTVQPTVTAQAQAVQRGVEFLLAHQSDDGAWRSEVYGHFRDGDALTPLVVVALQSVSERTKAAPAIERAMGWMEGLVRETKDGYRVNPDARLVYPIYTAALSIHALSDPAQAKRLPQREAWKRLLLDYQCSCTNGWKPDDRLFGGWGYYGIVPQRPKEGPIPPSWEANLSATAHAVTALRQAGVPQDHPAMLEARVFIDRCWNASPNQPDPSFDDGGYFFAPDDPFRNKAGIAGQQGNRVRFSSYGSATADGLRCEQALGHRTGKEQPSAKDWLLGHLKREKAFHQHGNFSLDRVADRDGAIFYYAAALREVLEVQDLPRMTSWLTSTQREDGSWRNERTTVREDDPIVATAFAILALK